MSAFANGMRKLSSKVSTWAEDNKTNVKGDLWLISPFLIGGQEGWEGSELN